MKTHLLVTGMMMALLVCTSCTKDDTIVTSSQGSEPESESEGGVIVMLAKLQKLRPVKPKQAGCTR